MTYLIPGLQMVAAITVLIAAWFWYRSACEKAPPVSTSWQGIIDLEKWLNRVGSHSRRAAGFTGISALLAGTSTILAVLI